MDNEYDIKAYLKNTVERIREDFKYVESLNIYQDLNSIEIKVKFMDYDKIDLIENANVFENQKPVDNNLEGR